MPKSSMSWREAHAWLAGYSAALAGEPWDSSNWDPDFTFYYQKGYANGERRRYERLEPQIEAADEAEALGTFQVDPDVIVESERIAV